MRRLLALSSKAYCIFVLCVFVVRGHALVRVWESEGNVRALVLFLHHAGPEHQILLLRIVSQFLYLLSHLVIWILSLFNAQERVTPNRTRGTLRSARGDATAFL